MAHPRTLGRGKTLAVPVKVQRYLCAERYIGSVSGVLRRRDRNRAPPSRAGRNNRTHMTPLLIAALALLGLIAGIYVSALIHDWRIGDLSATQYTAMHQMRDKTFRRVMPVLGLTTVVLVAASAAFAVDAGLPRVLAWIATALLVTDVALT